MPKIVTLDGQTLSFGKEGSYSVDDEKASILYLDKMFRTADMLNPDHISALQKDINMIAEMLNLGSIPEDGYMDDATSEAFQYFLDNRKLFLEYGITQHIDAKKLDKLTEPAEQVFTESEYAPTMDEMKALEVDIGKLYEGESVS